ncbi:DUF4880 domain-containing protein [Sphingomonas sp. 22176]|uniref:DUF4880 domain-containing protein n=1 Tax=Sphingomonas sp. 22176 TaxID=3453884 RepID=UPI003F87A5EF
MTVENEAIPNQVIDEAIAWMIAVREDALSAEDRVALDDWLNEDEVHLQAWTRLKGSLHPFRVVQDRLSATGLIASFERDHISRRAAVSKIFGVTAVGMVTLPVLNRFFPLATMTSDYGTRTAERRRFMLPDGTALALDARSGADLISPSHPRGLALSEGKAWISVSPAALPFRVMVAQLRITMMSGDLLVSNRKGRLQAIALNKPVVMALGGGPDVRVAGGAGLSLAGSTLRPLPPNETLDAVSWLDGRLILHDRTLGDLIDAYRPYQAGILSIASRAAALRVSGVFDLGNLEDALAMIQTTFPVRITQVGQLLTRMDLVRL